MYYTLDPYTSISSKFFILLTSAIIVLIWLAAFITTSKRRDTITTSQYTYYILYTSSILFWILTNAYFHTDLPLANHIDTTINIALLSNISAFLAFTFAFAFTCVLGNDKPNINTWQKSILLSTLTISLIINLIPELTIVSIDFKSAGNFSIHYSEYAKFFFLSISILIFSSVYNLLRLKKSNKKVMKIRSKYMVFGILTFMFSTLLIHLTMIYYFNDFSLTWLPPALSISELLFVGYALITSRFYSIKYIAYTLTSILLCTLLYAGFLSLLLFSSSSINESVLTLFCCAFIGLSWPRVYNHVSSFVCLFIYGQASSPVAQILSIENDFKSSISAGTKKLAEQLNIPSEQLEIVTNSSHKAFYQNYIDSNKTVLIADEVEDQLSPKSASGSHSLQRLYQAMTTSQIELVLPLVDHQKSVTHMLISSRKKDDSLFTIEEISALQTLLKRIQNIIEADRKVKQSQALANSIAHEMRNPLAQVQLQLEHLAELVRDKSDTSLMQEYLEAGDLAVLRGRQLIDIILREVNDSSLEQEAASPSSIRVAIEQALNRYGFETNSIRDRVKLNDGEDFVANINDTLFNFVIFNLLRNAIYYFDSYPESQIEISTLADTHENQVIFRDTGPGIDSRYVQRVFDDFYSHQKSGGSGLGLGYCRRVMESFGGRIECRSELGQYTEFIMHFPVQSVRLDEVKQSSNSPIFKTSSNQKSNVRYPHKPSKTLAGKTVLVVDDKEIQRALVTLYLSQLGMHTIQANDGESAVSICKSNPIDLILMDIQMPRMNGFEATALIKKITPTTPIIALSGESSPADIEKMAMLMDGRLEKPTTKNALAELMKVKLEQPVS